MLVLALLASPAEPRAEEPATIYRLGVLAPSFSWIDPGAVRFWLPEHGYSLARDLVYEARYAAGKDERLPELAAELVRLEVDVIVTAGASAIRAAKQATATIPIVMLTDGDPVRAGFVASLARPGGNITGVSALVPELAGKRLELLREITPSRRRIAVVWNPADPDRRAEWAATRTAAGRLGVELLSLEVRRREDFEPAFAEASGGRVGAAVVLADALTVSHADSITALAAKHRLPAMYASPWFVEANGGLMSYGVNATELGRRAAALVDKVLKGASPASLPIEQPTRFELVVNRRAARRLGLPIPPSVLIRADRVID